MHRRRPSFTVLLIACLDWLTLQLHSLSQKSKGYDYGKLFAKRSERLGNEKIQRKPSPSHLSPSSPGHRMRGLKSKSKPTPTSPGRNTTQIDRDHQLNAIGVSDSSNGNGIVHSDRMNGSVGTVHPTHSKSKD